MHFSTCAMQFATGLQGFRYVNPFSWPESSPDRTLWRFRDRLPIGRGVAPVSLGEGGTPLISSRLIPGISLLWKDETRNPTGSHKDRALSVAATHAVEIGARAMAVVSAGSTGISAAAYAARAGLASFTLMSRGVPAARTYPVFALGSRLIEVGATIDDSIDALERLAGRDGLYVCSTTRSTDPYQAEGCKTIAYEIVECLDRAPEWVIVPTGGGGTVSAIWRGFVELNEAKLVTTLPRLLAVVPSAYDALARAWREGIANAADFAALPCDPSASTVLSKLAHPHPPDGIEALVAIRASNGIVLSVTDEEALDAVGSLARNEGLYLEPSSAVVLPAVKQLAARGDIGPRDLVVALACGAGHRETFLVMDRRPPNARAVGLDDLERVLLGALNALP
jgi:threonine synthase